MSSATEPSADKTGQLFVRRSTGLVREASAIDAAIFNAVFSAPVGATLAWGVFFALAAFPGSDLITATLIAFVLNIPVLIMMGLLAASMPRTGGDYVWVSRILSPPLDRQPLARVEHSVDDIPLPRVGRNAPGGHVRMREQAVLLKLRKFVADRRRAAIELWIGGDRP